MPPAVKATYRTSVDISDMEDERHGSGETARQMRHRREMEAWKRKVTQARSEIREVSSREASHFPRDTVAKRRVHKSRILARSNCAPKYAASNTNLIIFYFPNPVQSSLPTFTSDIYPISDPIPTANPFKPFFLLTTLLYAYLQRAYRGSTHSQRVASALLMFKKPPALSLQGPRFMALRK